MKEYKTSFFQKNILSNQRQSSRLHGKGLSSKISLLVISRQAQGSTTLLLTKQRGPGRRHTTDSDAETEPSTSAGQRPTRPRCSQLSSLLLCQLSRWMPACLWAQAVPYSSPAHEEAPHPLAWGGHQLKGRGGRGQGAPTPHAPCPHMRR